MSTTNIHIELSVITLDVTLGEPSECHRCQASIAPYSRVGFQQSKPRSPCSFLLCMPCVDVALTAQETLVRAAVTENAS